MTPPAGDGPGNVILGILSDTHGFHQRTAHAIALLEQLGASAFVHCGDIGGEAVLDELAGRKAWVVPGNVDALDALIEEWTSQREPGEVMNTLQAAGVAAGVAARAVDALADPQLEHLNAFVEVDHPVVGKRIYPGIPFRITDMTFPESRPAPLFAEHTEEICREILQLPKNEIGRLADEGVIEIARNAQGKEPNR